MLRGDDYVIERAELRGRMAEAEAHALAVERAVRLAREEMLGEAEFERDMREHAARERRRRRVDGAVAALVQAAGVGLFLALALVFGKGSAR